jgi:hypothetical protein
VTVADAVRMIGLGRNTLYERITAGTVKVADMNRPRRVAVADMNRPRRVAVSDVRRLERHLRDLGWTPRASRAA